MRARRSKRFALLLTVVPAAGVVLAYFSRPGRSPNQREAWGLPTGPHASSGAEDEAGVPQIVGEDMAPSPLMEAKTPEEVRQVLALTRSADSGSIPVLRHMALESADPLVVGNALRALGRLKAVSRDPALAGLIRDPRIRVRQESIMALGESADPKAVEALSPLVGEHDPRIRPLVIHALGRIGGEKARGLVEGVLEDVRATPQELAFARKALSSIDRAAPAE